MPQAGPTRPTGCWPGRSRLAAIDALDTGVRGGPEPDSITLDNYGMPIPEA